MEYRTTEMHLDIEDKEMNPVEFINTIYLGDRGCLGINLDGVSHTIKLQVDCISRVRSPDGKWNFYNNEDIENGYLVFTGVETYLFDPQGFIPNDYIVSFAVREYKENFYEFTLELVSTTPKGTCQGVRLVIIAKGLYLEDPSKPNIKIYE